MYFLVLIVFVSFTSAKPSCYGNECLSEILTAIQQQSKTDHDQLANLELINSRLDRLEQTLDQKDSGVFSAIMSVTSGLSTLFEIMAVFVFIYGLLKIDKIWKWMIIVITFLSTHVRRCCPSEVSSSSVSEYPLYQEESSL